MINTAKENIKSFFHLNINKEKARDTGLAIVLILLILELFYDSGIYYKIAIPVLIIDMIVPQVYYPLAYLWFGFAHLLGTVVSKVILFLVFIFMVLPVALLRRLFGKDTLLLKNWNTNTTTIFRTRNHLFSSSDIEKPY